MADRFDLDAIAADDALLDLLAAGGESAAEAGEHDPALRLLAELRLAVEVEDEFAAETIDDPEAFVARCTARKPVTDPLARKVAARTLALSVAAVAALSVSGVAAAFTGDPLSPYEKVIEKVVDGIRPETTFPKERLDGLPVVDKKQIFKAAKDWRDQQEHRARRAHESDLKVTLLKNLPTAENRPAGADGDPRPPLARVAPTTVPTDEAAPEPNAGQPMQPTSVEQIGKPTVEVSKPPAPETTAPPVAETTAPPAPETTAPPVPETTTPSASETTTPSVPPAPAPSTEQGTSDTSAPTVEVSEPSASPTLPPTTEQSESDDHDSSEQSDKPSTDPSTPHPSPEHAWRTHPYGDEPGGHPTDSGEIVSRTDDTPSKTDDAAEQGRDWTSGTRERTDDEGPSSGPSATQTPTPQWGENSHRSERRSKAHRSEWKSEDNGSERKSKAHRSGWRSEDEGSEPRSKAHRSERKSMDHRSEWKSEDYGSEPRSKAHRSERRSEDQRSEWKSKARHSNGKVVTGDDDAKEAKKVVGKHSNGRYAEGRHAALDRAHGSMTPETVRQVLGVVNGVMAPR
jgi:hypothetical protein